MIILDRLLELYGIDVGHENCPCLECAEFKSLKFQIEKEHEIVVRLKKAYRKENNSEYGLVRKELIKSILDGGEK